MTAYDQVSSFHYLLHPYNTFLVTCCGAEGNANIITIAWLIPLSAEPPLLGLAVRPSRHSYGLIRETGEFVVNVAPFELAAQSLYCGRRSGGDVEKFTETGLTPEKAQQVQPPLIKECLAYLECRLKEEFPTGDHQLIVGEVLAAYARPGVLADDGLYDLAQVHPLFHIGRDRFTTLSDQTVEPLLED